MNGAKVVITPQKANEVSGPAAAAIAPEKQSREPAVAAAQS